METHIYADIIKQVDEYEDNRENKRIKLNCNFVLPKSYLAHTNLIKYYHIY